jgi:hypothetical protein
MLLFAAYPKTMKKVNKHETQTKDNFSGLNSEMFTQEIIDLLLYNEHS